MEDRNQDQHGSHGTNTTLSGSITGTSSPSTPIGGEGSKEPVAQGQECQARDHIEPLPLPAVAKGEDQIESEESELAASPQAEDGHIDIANEIAEVLARTNLSAYESRILWALWRKTYGWHKKADMISITQFQKITELKRQHVSRTVSELLKRNIITRIGDSRISTYGFQKDYIKWKNVTKRGDDVGIARGSGRVKKRTVTRIGDDLSPKGVTTKETNKRKYLEGSDPLRLATLLLEEIQKNKPDFKQPNLQVWSKDFDLMLRRDNRSADRIEKLIRWVQSDHGDGTGHWKGWAVNILSPGSLRKQFDRLELAMQGNKAPTLVARKERSPVRDLTGTGQVEMGE